MINNEVFKAAKNLKDDYSSVTVDPPEALTNNLSKALQSALPLNKGPRKKNTSYFDEEVRDRQKLRAIERHERDQLKREKDVIELEMKELNS